MAHGLEAIDWQAPWLAPFRTWGEPLADRVNAGEACSDVLNQHSLPVHGHATGVASIQFVPQSALQAGTAYESYIFQTRSVPTREGLHDFFNGLCWLHFPLTKTRLNVLQSHEIERQATVAVRGKARDALTIFDENAAFLYAPDELWDALMQHNWQRLFIDLRPMWTQARLQLFGHALLEKLVNPRKAMTAHVYRVQKAIDSIASLDAWVAQDVQLEKLQRKPFFPMPVLGVPGWWEENTQPDFYDDSHVFRPARHS